MAKYGQLNGKHTELFEIFENLLWNLILYKTQKPFFLKEGNGKLMLYNSHLCWHALPMLRFLCLVSCTMTNVISGDLKLLIMSYSA